MLIKGVMSSFQHHAQNIVMYFDNSWLAGTQKRNYDHKKAADNHFSISSFFHGIMKKVRIRKRTVAAT